MVVTERVGKYTVVTERVGKYMVCLFILRDPSHKGNPPIGNTNQNTTMVRYHWRTAVGPAGDICRETCSEPYTHHRTAETR